MSSMDGISPGWLLFGVTQRGGLPLWLKKVDEYPCYGIYLLKSCWIRVFWYHNKRNSSGSGIYTYPIPWIRWFWWTPLSLCTHWCALVSQKWGSLLHAYTCTQIDARFILHLFFLMFSVASNQALERKRMLSFSRTWTNKKQHSKKCVRAVSVSLALSGSL